MSDPIDKGIVDEKEPVIETPENNFDPDEGNENKQTVAWESHQKLLAQRKADQKKAQVLEAQLKELQTKVKQSENAKLEEKQEYKKLYEATKAELEAQTKEKLERDRIMVNKEKQGALSKELGGLRNDAYFKFADLDNIVIGDDGQIDQTSLRLEANRFRTAYPELVQSVNKVRVNNHAPGNDGIIIKEQKQANKMTAQEREEFKRSQLRARSQ